MKIVAPFMNGFLTVLKIVGAPMLYRYPYRTSSEAFCADWQNIAKDIETVMGKLEATNGKRRKRK